VIPVLSLLVAAHSILSQTVPAGTALHVRLAAPIGSYASQVGSPVEAVLIAPVRADGRTILPAGSQISGVVKSVRRVGLGIVHETSSLAIDFNSVTAQGSGPVRMGARLAAVDNGREAVTPGGTIIETRATGTWSSRAAHVARMMALWSVHTDVAVFAVKAMLVRVPEPEIYLPSGAELTLMLTEAIAARGVEEPEPGPRPLAQEERAELAQVVARLPERTFAPSGRPSDFINLLLIGDGQEIAEAFTAAGWIEARATSFKAGIEDAFAVMENRGNPSAPMSPLLVNGASADMSWEKGLNNLAKRHHVRLWRRGRTEDGRQIWIGAATRDIDFAYMRRGRLMTHRIEAQVDHEREKVAGDLAFTGCVDAQDSLERPGGPRRARNATGDWMETDGRLAVIVMDACPERARLFPESGAAALPMHGNAFQRILRGQIMSARSDLIRANPYWQMYARVRILARAVWALKNGAQDPDAAPKPTLASRLRPDRIATIISLR